MNKFFYKIMVGIGVIIVTSLLSETLANVSQEEYDYSHIKRECEIRIVTPDGIPLPYILVGFTLLRHRFIFGGTIRSEGFDSLGDNYGEMFENYFKAAVPENEMKWSYVMKGSQKSDPDFSKADFLITWANKKNILIMGNCLFSNEKESDLPEWARSLGSLDFKQAILEHITTTLTHFNGKLFQWNIINGICYGEDGLLPSGGILQTKTNDSTVFSWILDEANRIDSAAEVVITDYDIINDSARAENFIARVKPLSEKFDVVGVVAHFGAEVNKNSYQSKINYIAEKLGKPILLTDVDFSCDINVAPAKLEELMRGCFANPNVRGIVMGSWHQRYRRKEILTNYFVDSLNKETPVGQRWREIIDEWKFTAGGNVDDSGKIRFNGFVGQYQVLISCFLDTFSVVPGEGTQKIDVVYHHIEPEKVIYQPFLGNEKIEVKINEISIKLLANYKTPLFITTYSLTGQRISRLPLNLLQKGYRLTLPSTTRCYILRIETDKGLPLYVEKMVRLR